MLGSTLLASILLAATGVNAHATFQELWVNGADKAGTCVRTVSSNSPVTSVSGSDITCNVGGTKAAASTCAVSAGDTVTVEMHQQPNDRSCSNEAIGGNHDGPVIVYLAKVDDVTTSNPSSAGWFKIAQTGLVSKDYWGTDVLNKNCGKYDVKIPSDIAPGNYLLRAEVIALHVAGSVGGAQFYVSCYQLQVSGSGSASPATVKFPGAYSATDPGIKFDLYGSYTSYTVPGPAVYGGGGNTGGSPGTTQAPTTTFTTSRATTSTAAPSTTAVGGTVAQYGQCGGEGYNGPTTCASPYTCKAVSPPYYYQCQ